MIIFASIFGVGFLTLILSLIFGTDHDIDVHDDIGGGGDHGPSVFSAKMVALAMVGFGAVGFGFRATYEWSMFRSSMAGIGGAIAIGIIGYFILRAFYASQASSTINDSDIVGVSGNVIDAIGKTDYGQITCVVRGREMTFMARTTDSEPIQRNSPVKVVSKSGPVVTVSRID